jgi:hypothetical protein
LGYVVAGLVAALLAGLELRTRLRTRFTLTGAAWAWWLARLGLEFGIGALAYGLVDVAADGPWSEGVYTWIAAGAAGPAAVRLRVVELGRGESAQPFGLASVYDPVRGFLEEQLDDIGAEQQSRWIHHDVLPRLRDAVDGPAHVANRLREYIGGLRRLTDAERLAERQHIDQVVSDAGTTPDEKLELLVLRACQIRAFRTVKGLIDECDPSKPVGRWRRPHPPA